MPTGYVSGHFYTLFQDGGANSGWAEWSVEDQTDPQDREAWYETNPSLDTTLTERKTAGGIGTGKSDFNIQRPGLWLQYTDTGERNFFRYRAVVCVSYGVATDFDFSQLLAIYPIKGN